MRHSCYFFHFREGINEKILHFDHSFTHQVDRFKYQSGSNIQHFDVPLKNFNFKLFKSSCTSSDETAHW